MKMIREEIINDLRRSDMMVIFTKADGTRREMKCTRVSSHIPEEHKPKGKGPMIENHDTIRVFDLEKQQWRAFRVDSVIDRYPLANI